MKSIPKGMLKVPETKLIRRIIRMGERGERNLRKLLKHFWHFSFS